MPSGKGRFVVTWAREATLDFASFASAPFVWRAEVGVSVVLGAGAKGCCCRVAAADAADFLEKGGGDLRPTTGKGGGVFFPDAVPDRDRIPGRNGGGVFRPAADLERARAAGGMGGGFLCTLVVAERLRETGGGRTSRESPGSTFAGSLDMWRVVRLFRPRVPRNAKAFSRSRAGYGGLAPRKPPGVVLCGTCLSPGRWIGPESGQSAGRSDPSARSRVDRDHRGNFLLFFSS